MATHTPPPPKRSKGKGEPPTTAKKNKGEPPPIADTRSNLSKPEPGKIVDMNFKVPAEFKRDFKIAAANHDMTQKDLLMEIFREWSQRKG